MAAADDITLFTTEKGKDGLGFRGFLYRLGKYNADDTILWRCLERKTCPGTLKTNGAKQNAVEVNAHTYYTPKPELVVVRKVRTNVRTRTCEETTALPTIYRQETNRLINNPVAAALMPVYASISSTMYR
jgi:hypothetical protein